MGLLGSIVKIGTKAFKYGKRALNCAPEFILGESSQVIGKAYKASNKTSIFAKAKDAGKAFENHVGTLKAAKGGFFSRLFKTTIGLPKALTKSTKAGIRLARMKGTNKFLGALKGLGKGIGKKMPYIGALLTIAFEIPNIVAGYKKDGIFGALKQTGGAGIELGFMAAGSAIGSCIAPGVGTIIGGIIGSFVGMFARNAIVPEASNDEAETSADGSQDTTDTSSNPASGTSSSDGASSSSSSSSTESSSSESGTSSSGSTTSTTSPVSTLNPGMSMTNPFGMNYATNFPTMGMGFGYPTMGMTGGMNMFNPSLAYTNPILQPGENFFQKYPMGYKFQYLG